MEPKQNQQKNQTETTWEKASLSPGEYERLFASVHQKAQQQKHRAIQMRRWHIVGLSGMGLLALLTIAHISLTKLFPIILPIATLYAISGITSVKSRLAWGQASFAVAQLNDTRSVGLLIDTLDIEYTTYVEQAKAALTRLLPRLKASDSNLLSDTQRDCLYRHLNVSYVKRNTDLAIAILKALEQVGDEKAIPYVEKLLHHLPKTSPVAEAARNCLPYLQQYAHQQSLSGTLLRAASSGRTDTLLRPVGNSAETVPEQLLRASVTYDGEESR